MTRLQKSLDTSEIGTKLQILVWMDARRDDIANGEFRLDIISGKLAKPWCRKGFFSDWTIDFVRTNQNGPIQLNPKKAGPYPGSLDKIKLLAFGYDDYDVLCLDTLGKFKLSALCGLYLNNHSRTGINRWLNQNEYPWRLYFMGLGCD